MEIDELEKYLTAEDDNTVVQEIMGQVKCLHDNDKYKQYDPYCHKVHDALVRKDKRVFVPDGVKVDGAGKPVMKEDIVKVNRLSIPMQKLLVRRSAAFIVGGKMKLVANIKPDDTISQSLFDAVQGSWKDNKLQFKNKQIVKRFLAETECAEIWFKETKTVDGKEVTSMRMNIVSPALGNTLYPVFDAAGDMIAFGYDFQTDKNRYFNLYTADKLRMYSQEGNKGWVLDEEIDLIYGKIPVIYYSQDAPQWWDVQPLIERLEILISSHADTDDYNGSPILKLKGKVEGMAAKGEAGKAFQMDEGADVDYVTWDSAPESIKLEMENLRSWIFGGTQIPDLSPEFLKSLGDISGAALDRILIDGHLLAMDYQDGVYGEGLQRRNNFLVAAHVAINPAFKPAATLDVNNEFSLFRINDEGERIANATLANGGKPVLSQKTSVSYAGLVADADAEWQLIQDEQDALGSIVTGLV